LKYTEHSYKEAWWLMLSNLNQVGKHYYANGIQAAAEPVTEQESEAEDTDTDSHSHPHPHLD
jgi:hypothetical protein